MRYVEGVSRLTPELSPEDERPVAETDPGRVDRPGRMHGFQAEARVVRVPSVCTMGLARPPADALGELGVRATKARRGLGAHPHLRRQSESGSSGRVSPRRCSASASSARVDSASGVAAIRASLAYSEARSASRARASASCSSEGSREAASEGLLEQLSHTTSSSRGLRETYPDHQPRLRLTPEFSCGLRRGRAGDSIAMTAGVRNRALLARQLERLVSPRPTCCVPPRRPGAPAACARRVSA